jgi:hypothetical protein
MAPQLLLSLLLLPLSQPTQENTPTLKSLFLSMKMLQGTVFLGLLGAVSQGQDKEQLLSWMNDSHPKFLTFILKML